jgi:hypothetical protein
LCGTLDSDAVGLQGHGQVVNLVSLHLLQGADNFLVSSLNQALALRVIRAPDNPLDTVQACEFCNQTPVLQPAVDDELEWQALLCEDFFLEELCNVYRGVLSQCPAFNIRGYVVAAQYQVFLSKFSIWHVYYVYNDLSLCNFRALNWV